MISNSSTNIVSIQQLMLEKMQDMAVKSRPAFEVSSHPIDTQVVDSVQNKPLSFSTTMKGVLDAIDQQQSLASEKMTAVETGKSDDLVGAMIASQKANLSFSALLQVRNKVVSSFDDIMKMPV